MIYSCVPLFLTMLPVEALCPHDLPPPDNPARVSYDGPLVSPVFVVKDLWSVTANLRTQVFFVLSWNICRRLFTYSPRAYPLGDMILVAAASDGQSKA